MTQQQFLESLTPEQSSALIETRDALMAANSAAMKEIGDMLAAANAALPTITAERDVLKSTIANFLAADSDKRAVILAEAAKSTEQKARDAAQAKLDAAQADVVAAQAELTAAAEKVEAKK